VAEPVPRDATGESRAAAPSVAESPVAAAAEGRLAVNVLPFARIVIDGRSVGESRLWEGALPVGSHRVELRHDCCEPLVRETAVREGAVTQLRERLVPRGATLMVRLHGPPDASVMVDDAFQRTVDEGGGKPVVVSMARDNDGRWRYDREVTVRLFARGFREWSRTIRLRAGQTLPLDVTMEPSG